MCWYLYPMVPVLAIASFLLAGTFMLSFIASKHPKLWDSFFHIPGERRKYGMFDIVAQLRILKFLLLSPKVPSLDHSRLSHMLTRFRVAFVVQMALIIPVLMFFARNPVGQFCKS